METIQVIERNKNFIIKNSIEKEQNSSVMSQKKKMIFEMIEIPKIKESNKEME